MRLNLRLISVFLRCEFQSEELPGKHEDCPKHINGLRVVKAGTDLQPPSAVEASSTSKTIGVLVRCGSKWLRSRASNSHRRV